MSENTLSTDDVDYSQILDQMNVCVVVINADGKIIRVNQSAIAMFGYSSSQMLNSNVSLLMPPLHANRHDEYIKRHLDTDKSTVVGCGRYLEGLKADGTVFPIHVSLGRHMDGGAVFFIGVIHDLSEIQQNRNRALRFGQIIEESVNEIYVFRPDTLVFSFVNRGALTNLGYSSVEMETMTPLDVKKNFTESSFRALLKPLLEKEVDRVSFQSTHTRKDGSVYDTDVVFHLSTVVSPNEIVVIIVDCTERNRLLDAVQMAQKMNTIGELAGGIAHDFNNLLTVIVGNLEMLETSKNDEESLDLIAEARQAANRGAQITSRLLSFSRQKTLIPKRLNINDVVLDLSDLLTRSAGSSIIVSLMLSPNICTVKADQSQLDNALLNLTINARDAMPNGGTLTISSRNRSVSPTDAEPLQIPAGKYAELVVADTGTGIEPDELQRIFEPFYTTKPKSGGSGLGLSMAYGFAKQSGGILQVQSKRGEGSTFSMLLPCNSSSLVDVSRGSIPGRAVAKGISVLLVEDEESVRKLTARRLLNLGYEVIESSSAEEALSIYSNSLEIGLILTDMVMSGKLSGWDLFIKIRETNASLPIIITSGYSNELKQMDISTFKHLSILHKPYTEDVLGAFVSDALSDII